MEKYKFYTNIFFSAVHLHWTWGLTIVFYNMIDFNELFEEDWSGYNLFYDQMDLQLAGGPRT